MLTRFIKSTFKTPVGSSNLMKSFSSKIKTNRNFGEKAPPKDRKLAFSSKSERQASFPNGNLPFHSM